MTMCVLCLARMTVLLKMITHKIVCDTDRKKNI